MSPGSLDGFERGYRRQQAEKRLRTLGIGLVLAAALVASALIGEVDPARLAAGLPQAWAYVWGTVPVLRAETLGADLGEWYWGFGTWLRLAGETVLMGFTGTVLGGAAGLLLCFPASRNLVQGRALHFACRRVLEVARTVPELVYALIFVYAFGLGPFAGVLAIAVHTAGALGKLFAEVNENVDPGPIEGVRAAGAAWPAIMRLAVLPQVLPNFASYALLRFEINVRSASAIGIVGAGGIGEELYLSVRQFEYPDISAILLLIIALVSIIDLGCEAVRHRLIGRDALRMV
ncbi:phosphonate ABC transporter, permease protein PhnE [Inquilinus limosus]|uniref:Phosphonate ABC transporter, permease protein PhnE n=1 Tax=Inquilinus limosus TaxID=171674 RepID=A0A211ZH97_9PROT|nr:phosphonate ABC transporter, permease protein PhnE [Inquilinus limosus]OWJ64613.1 phosphonate ABC transporter, permease protein PhnE [Inquilinus limosus]